MARIKVHRSCSKIKITTIAVGILEFIAILIILIAVIVVYTQGPKNVVSSTISSFAFGTGNNTQRAGANGEIHLESNLACFICAIIGFVLGTASIIGLLIGVIIERPKLIGAHLIFQVLALLGLLVGVFMFGMFPYIAVSFISIADQNSTSDQAVVISDQSTTALPPYPAQIKQIQGYLASVFCIVMNIALVIQLYFMHVVITFFRHLSNKLYLKRLIRTMKTSQGTDNRGRKVSQATDNGGKKVPQNDNGGRKVTPGANNGGRKVSQGIGNGGQTSAQAVFTTTAANKHVRLSKPNNIP